MAIDISLGAGVDQYLENLPVGSLSRSIGDALYGINARHKSTPLPRPRDSYGYTFFTRPMFNLTENNISNTRKFFSMLTANQLSYQRYVRMMLDPRLAYNGYFSPFVDPMNAFIPLLSNSLISLSGWPDLQVPVYETPNGLFNQRHSHVDGVTNEYETFDLNMVFKNTRGSPILYLLLVWIYYQTYVYQGLLNPYLDMVIENEMDYTTRIYRLITDDRNKYLTHIACTGAAFPTSSPVGTIFDFNAEKPYLDSITDLNYQFKCSGFMFDEDILKLEFNQTQCLFNPAIAGILEHDMTSTDIGNIRREDPTVLYTIKDSPLVKIPHHLSVISEESVLDNSYYNLNYNMYPYINLATNELEWWAPRRNVNIQMS